MVAPVYRSRAAVVVSKTSGGGGKTVSNGPAGWPTEPFPPHFIGETLHTCRTIVDRYTLIGTQQQLLPTHRARTKCIFVVKLGRAFSGTCRAVFRYSASLGTQIIIIKKKFIRKSIFFAPKFPKMLWFYLDLFPEK